MSLGPDVDSIDKLWTLAKETASKGDFPGTLFLLRALAEKGQWSACARIGELYETGPLGIDRDAQQAVKWYRRAVFESDDSIAHLGMGRALFNGSGVDKDEASARVHFEKAFVHGEAEAGVYLGLICLNERNIERAKYYFNVAAEAGYCFAHVGLGRIAFRELNLAEGFCQFKNTLIKTISTYRKDPSDRRLLGIVTQVNWAIPKSMGTGLAK